MWEREILTCPNSRRRNNYIRNKENKEEQRLVGRVILKEH